MTATETDLAPDTGRHADHAWNPVTRIVFRFCFSYFGLFCLFFPWMWFSYLIAFRRVLPDDATVWSARPVAPIVGWVGRHLFGVSAVPNPYSQGDDPFEWVLVFCILVAAVAVTVMWSLLDRRRTEYRGPADGFLLAMRLALAGQMFYYGVAKLIPNQMPEPPLATWLQRFGDFSPDMVLWNQVGYSQPYEMLLGAAEVLGGVLLLLPRTAVLGAMLCLADMAQVFVLNMTFGVSVKLLSAHLILLSVVLLAPRTRQLLDAVVLGRATAAVPGGRRSRRTITTLQVAALIWLAVGNGYQNWRLWYEIGGGRPVSALYGIWEVTSFDRDGQSRPLLLTDRDLWRRIVFDDPDTMTYQQTDDRLVPVIAHIDTAAHRVTLSRPDPGSAPSEGPDHHPSGSSFAVLDYQRPEPNHLRLTGDLDGHHVTITLDLVDPASFPLRASRFQWVQR
ncbi:DoxX family membrane protein [Nocardia arthritidis]|uniref:DoxX family membrane protein n=1 Tax=Nocardia arthritidis TaxID=228602 RepID=A0A6G9YGA3_9NOCA|nr:DoxX family membrane protein [Nocardia arthritidis]QIS12251.1 DoxX family membrane protein [Nocardia arthritidis]